MGLGAPRPRPLQNPAGEGGNGGGLPSPPPRGLGESSGPAFRMALVGKQVQVDPTLPTDRQGREGQPQGCAQNTKAARGHTKWQSCPACSRPVLEHVCTEASNLPGTINTNYA